jgi:N-methylhydantoinase B/oxoprolinase/acetone carboxylase alpha subunit
MRLCLRDRDRISIATPGGGGHGAVGDRALSG